MPKVNRKKFKTGLTAEDVYDKLLAAWDWAVREDSSLFEFEISNILEEAGLIATCIDDDHSDNCFTDLVDDEQTPK